MQLNGAAARLVQPGNLVIVMAYQQVLTPVPAEWHPKVVLVDPTDNSIAEVITSREDPHALRGVTLRPELMPEVDSEILR